MGRTSLTKIGWFLGVSAAAVLFWIGLTYVFSPIEEDRFFGYLNLMEGCFALTGILVMDVIAGKDIDLWPDQFEKIDDKTFLHTGAILGVLVILQFAFQFTLLRARPIDKVLSIIFAAPAEELFFRGTLMTPLIKNKSSTGKVHAKLGGYELIDMDINDFIAIMLSATAFTFIHVNYYDFPILMLFVFFSGIVLAFFYAKFENLTANILAHLFLNIIIALPSFYQIQF